MAKSNPKSRKPVLVAKGRKAKKSGALGKDECTIPGPVATSVLNKSVLKRSEHEERAIREYVEWQARKEKVTHSEKVTTEHLLDRKLDAWDVRTNKSRYWVITNPTNLYSQKLFPSLDSTISFHVGVTTRTMADRKGTASDEQEDRLASAWRRWTQAAEALDRADEAEEFQSVGMRCRECLIALARSVACAKMVPEGQESPKASDFIHWSELIANAIASGPSAQEVRGYLKAMAKSTWQMVSWLTHASNAARFDGHMAVEATQNVLAAFGSALIRYERGTPDRCPRCSSYRIATSYQPELETELPYVHICESCGWSKPSETESTHTKAGAKATKATD